MSPLIEAGQTFPPAFHDSPFSYGFALFGLLIMAAVSLSRTVYSVRHLDLARNGWRTPVTLARFGQIGLFSAILLLTAPDLAVLLLWNEINDVAMVRLWALDRLFDGLALIPFMWAVILILRGQFRMIEQLIRPPLPEDLFSAWPQIRRQLGIIFLVAVIAVGVAVGKTYLA